MKKVLIAALIIAALGACNKPNDEGGNHDPKPLTKKEILVQKPWQVDELWHHILGVNSHYIRNTFNNTNVPYENLRFVFNADGSGTTTQQDGTVYPTTWELLGSDQRNLQLSVTYSSSSTISYQWHMVEIAGNYLHATVELEVSGDPNNLEAFRLVQMP